MRSSARASADLAPEGRGLSAPRLRPAYLDDYDAIARLESAHAMKVRSPDDWRRMWLDNPSWPRHGTRWPIGWVFETPAGEVVGSVVNVPSSYVFRGQTLVCANGRGWVTAPPYRGYALWLMDTYFEQPDVDLFVNTTVSETAEPMIASLSSRIPVGDWAAGSYWVTGHVEYARQRLRARSAPLAALSAYPLGAALWLKDVARRKSSPRSARSVDVESVERFDARFDAFWETLVRENPQTLLAERSSRALAWHFGVPMRRGMLWTFTASQSGRLVAFCTFVRKGDGRQAYLADYQTIEPGADILSHFIDAALLRCAREGVYVLRNVGRGVPKMRMFDERAPYRSRHASWKYYYRAGRPDLDVALRDPRSWDPSLYDGDASFD